MFCKKDIFLLQKNNSFFKKIYPSIKYVIIHKKSPDIVEAF